MEPTSDVSMDGGVVVKRKVGQSVLIGENIRVVLMQKNRLRIIAPKSVRVLRSEVALRNYEGADSERGETG